MGHEERFPRLRPSGRCGFREGTFAGTFGKDKDAPFPDLLAVAAERGSSTLLSPSSPIGQRPDWAMRSATKAERPFSVPPRIKL